MEPDFIELIRRLKLQTDSQALYQEIISLGKISPLKKQWTFQDKDIVNGCQSLLYVRCMNQDGKLFFEFFSDAIFSSGLAALLVSFYNGKTLKEFLTSPP